MTENEIKEATSGVIDSHKSTEIPDVHEKNLESMTKWMRDSGLVVNKDKTEVCLFFKHKCRPVHLTLGGTRLETKMYYASKGYNLILDYCGHNMWQMQQKS
jgi:hypothetical protein